MKRFLAHLTLTLALLPGLLPAAELETATATKRETAREFWLDGDVEAINRTTLSAQTQGQVQEILFDVDDYVEAGQVVIRLKATEQQAGLSQAKADLKEANARLTEAQDSFNRNKDLFGKKLVAQSALDKSTAGLKSARARKDAAEAGLVKATQQFEYTRVRAPYSGIVTQRHVEVGEIASPGQKLMSGISLDQLRVTVDMPQSLIPVIREQRKARVMLPTGETIEAASLTIFPFADQASNTFKVRVELPEGVKDLFPGMFGKTAFVTGAKKELVIPVDSVVYRSEVTAVYVVDEEGVVHFRRIRAGKPAGDGMMSVIAGLSPGDQVAIDPVAAAASLKQRLAESHNE